jgi:hypothetical protein
MSEMAVPITSFAAQAPELLDNRERYDLPAGSIGSVAARRFVEISENVVELPNPYRAYRVDQYPFDLSLELTTSVGALKAEHQERGEEFPDLVAVRIDKQNRYGDLARYHEARIFKQEWYQDMDPEEYAHEMVEEFGEYDQASRFLLILDTTQTLEDGTFPTVGISRMVDGKEARLKTVNDMDAVWSYPQTEVEKDLRKTACPWYEMSAHDRRVSGLKEYTWDISSLAVAKEYRNTSAAAYAILSHEMSVWALEEGVKTWTTVFVTKFFDLFSKYKGIPFRPICNVEPEMHMGALSIPAVLHLNELPAMQADPHNHRAPKSFNELVRGEGMEYAAVKA